MRNTKYFQSLPKKIMAAGVLFLNGEQEILIVKPVYTDHWQLPGGVVNKNESPYHGARREVQEELGLEIKNLQFLTVDYVASTIEEKVESLQFVFWGGQLNPRQIQEIKLPPKELSAYKFVPLKQAVKLTASKKYFISLPGRLAESFQAAMNDKNYYLENGQKR